MKEEIRKLIEIEHIDTEKVPTEQLYEMFNELNGQMTVVYHFVLGYLDYMNMGHDYTAEENLTMLEAHLLTDICDIENSTATSLAHTWHRSTSATSQTIRKLIGKELIYRVNSKEDAKIFYLRPTEKGLRVSDAHKRYDTLDIIKTLKSLHHTLSLEEIEMMFKGLQVYSDLLHKNN